MSNAIEARLKRTEEDVIEMQKILIEIQKDIRSIEKEQMKMVTIMNANRHTISVYISLIMIIFSAIITAVLMYGFGRM